jgi:hypothetical protein
MILTRIPEVISMTEQFPCAESLEKRIARLERQNLRMKWGVTFVSMILVIGTIISCRNSQTQSQNNPSSLTAKTIQAESIALVSGGEVIARLTHDASDTSLIFQDAKGNRRLAIGVASDGPFAGPFLEMFPAEGQRGLNSMEMAPGMNHMSGRH